MFHVSEEPNVQNLLGLSKIRNPNLSQQWWKKVELSCVRIQSTWLTASVLGWTVSSWNSYADILSPDALEFVSILDKASSPSIPPHPGCCIWNPRPCAWALLGRTFPKRQSSHKANRGLGGWLVLMGFLMGRGNLNTPRDTKNVHTENKWGRQVIDPFCLKYTLWRDLLSYFFSS